jgi:hypothetical protein
MLAALQLAAARDTPERKANQRCWLCVSSGELAPSRTTGGNATPAGRSCDGLPQQAAAQHGDTSKTGAADDDGHRCYGCGFQFAGDEDTAEDWLV